MLKSINSFEGVKIDKKLMCFLTDKCITGLIHSHRNSGQTNFANSTSCRNENCIHRI